MKFPSLLEKYTLNFQEYLCKCILDWLNIIPKSKFLRERHKCMRVNRHILSLLQQCGHLEMQNSSTRMRQNKHIKSQNHYSYCICEYCIPSYSPLVLFPSVCSSLSHIVLSHKLIHLHFLCDYQEFLKSSLCRNNFLLESQADDLLHLC